MRKRTSEQVSLIMDNASSHESELIDPTGQVTPFALPPNFTAVHQPMDCGVIFALKARYNYMFLKKTVGLLEHIEALRTASKIMMAATKGIYEGHQPHVLDAAELIVDFTITCNQPLSSVAG